MTAGRPTRAIFWPLGAAWATLRGLGRFTWHLFLASNPFTIALWMMYHDHYEDSEEDPT